MVILGVETSTFATGIAVVEGDRVVGESYLDKGPSHSEKLLPTIDWILNETGIDKTELNALAVSVGPGSFTALRIGISAVKGLAYSLSIPVAGVSTLEIIASNFSNVSYPICTVVDAKKNEIYTAFFDQSRNEVCRLREDTTMTPGELVGEIKEKTLFTGSGALLYRDFLEDNLGDIAIFSSNELGLPRASNCALLGARKLRCYGSDNTLELTPLYLRKSDAEIYHEERHHE